MFSGQIATFSASFVLVKILTEYLSPEEYGILSLGITVTVLLNQMLTGGISAGITRIYSIAANRDDLKNYADAVHYLKILISGVIFLLGSTIVLVFYLFNYFQWAQLAAVAVVLAVVTSLNDIETALHNAAQHRFIVSFHNSVNAWMKILFALLLIKIYKATSVVVLFGYIFSTVITLFSQYFLFKNFVFHRYDNQLNRRDWLRQILKYSGPVSIWGAFMCFKQLSDRWALQSFATISDVGKYAVLLQISFTPIVQIASIGLSFFSPILYQTVGDASDQSKNFEIHILFWRYLKYCGLVTFLILVATGLLHKRIFELLVAKEYQNISYLLPWMIAAGAAFAAGQVLNLKIETEMRPAAMITAKVTSTIIGVMLNLLGAWIWSLPGVVGALVIYSFIYFGWMARLARSIHI
jgi:O-antigen/teichoic acid export membrane protein